MLEMRARQKGARAFKSRFDVGAANLPRVNGLIRLFTAHVPHAHSKESLSKADPRSPREIREESATHSVPSEHCESFMYVGHSVCTGQTPSEITWRCTEPAVSLTQRRPIHATCHRWSSFQECRRRLIQCSSFFPKEAHWLMFTL